MDKKNELKTISQHDAQVFRDGDLIFSEGDLREMINTIYGTYQYKGAQYNKLTKMRDFLAVKDNRFSHFELTDHCDKLCIFLNNFSDFLNNNFYQEGQTEDGDLLYLFKTEETSSATEAFLIEFQLLSLDIEKAYRNYRSAFISRMPA